MREKVGVMFVVVVGCCFGEKNCCGDLILEHDEMHGIGCWNSGVYGADI
jgi:hypothetical protein